MPVPETDRELIGAPADLERLARIVGGQDPAQADRRPQSRLEVAVRLGQLLSGPHETEPLPDPTDVGQAGTLGDDRLGQGREQVESLAQGERALGPLDRLERVLVELMGTGDLGGHLGDDRRIPERVDQPGVGGFEELERVTRPERAEQPAGLGDGRPGDRDRVAPLGLDLDGALERLIGLVEAAGGDAARADPLERVRLVGWIGRDVSACAR